MVNISFSGSGFLSSYHLGVIRCLRDNAPNLVESFEYVGGSSGGALSALMLAARLSEEEVFDGVLETVRKARSGLLGPFSPLYDLQSDIDDFLRKVLPEDAHVRLSGRLFVSLTAACSGKNELVNQFSSRQELITALKASCCVPIWAGFKLWQTFRGKKYVDGGFSNVLPVKFSQGDTITVSPFSGTADISPVDGMLPTRWMIPVAQSHFNLSLANGYRTLQSIWPGDDDKLFRLFDNGYEDCLCFLSKRGLLEEERICPPLHLTGLSTETSLDQSYSCQLKGTCRTRSESCDTPEQGCVFIRSMPACSCKDSPCSKAARHTEVQGVLSVADQMLRRVADFHRSFTVSKWRNMTPRKTNTTVETSSRFLPGIAWWRFLPVILCSVWQVMKESSLRLFTVSMERCIQLAFYISYLFAVVFSKVFGEYNCALEGCAVSERRSSLTRKELKFSRSDSAMALLQNCSIFTPVTSHRRPSALSWYIGTSPSDCLSSPSDDFIPGLSSPVADICSSFSSSVANFNPGLSSSVADYLNRESVTATKHVSNVVTAEIATSECTDEEFSSPCGFYSTCSCVEVAECSASEDAVERCSLPRDLESAGEDYRSPQKLESTVESSSPCQLDCVVGEHSLACGRGSTVGDSSSPWNLGFDNEKASSMFEDECSIEECASCELTNSAARNTSS